MKEKYKNRIVGSGTMNPADIKMNPLNWRKHPKEQSKALDDALSRLGWIQDVIVNKTTGHLIDGHLRVETALKNKEAEVPVKYVELTEEEEKIALATFDPLTMMAEQDDAMLKKLLEDCGTDVDMSQYHEDYDKLMRVEHSEEELEAVPDVPKVAKTKRGDVYRLGEHVLMCGDSTSSADVKLLMQEERAQMLFTSPPYSDMREYKGGDLSVNHLVKFIPTYKPYSDYQCVNLGIQRRYYEIVQYWDEYIAEAKQSGLKLLAWNVWDKTITGSIGQQKFMFPLRHEWIFVFGEQYKELNRTVDKKCKESIGKYKSTTRRQPDGTTIKDYKLMDMSEYKPMESVCAITSELSDVRSLHPAVFPVALPVEYIKAMTQPNDIVVEPFGGAGSTLIACEETNRRCRIMELAPEYCDVIVERWEKLTGKHAELIREGGNNAN